MNDNDDGGPSPRLFWSCATVGLAMLAFGVGGPIVEGERSHPGQ